MRRTRPQHLSTVCARSKCLISVRTRLQHLVSVQARLQHLDAVRARPQSHRPVGGATVVGGAMATTAADGIS
jgi:hypothetical protein